MVVLVCAWGFWYQETLTQCNCSSLYCSTVERPDGQLCVRFPFMFVLFCSREVKTATTYVYAYVQHSRDYENRAIAGKMFETLAMFKDSLKGYFSSFLGIRGKIICMWEGFLHSAHSGSQRRSQSLTFF
jgi:hypothetical protein